MISSIITRQQALVSSGQVTSTLESGLISLAIQAWLSLYASSSSSSSSPTNPSPETAANFSSYVSSILSAISVTEEFTNVTATARLPLDRLTVAQALAGLERGVENEAKQRQLTMDEAAALNTLNTSLAVQQRNQYGGFWCVLDPWRCTLFTQSHASLFFVRDSRMPPMYPERATLGSQAAHTLFYSHSPPSFLFFPHSSRTH